MAIRVDGYLVCQKPGSAGLLGSSSTLGAG
jgi:hypothetical protein